MTRIRAVAAVAALALLVSACAQHSDAGGARPPAGPSPTLMLPDDPAALVLQVAYTGGFLTPELIAGRLPVVSVYADGRVLTEGPVPAIYPGPAWPNVQVQQADVETVRSLVDSALAAGVAEATDVGTPGIADAPSTRFTVTTASGTSVREVYALTEGAGDPNLTAVQQEARGKLVGLLTELSGLPNRLGPEGRAPAPYEPTAVAAVVRPWSPPQGDPALGDQPALPWPGPALPGEAVAPGVTCVLASGEQARTVAAAARGANQLTPWSTGDGARWWVGFRPLLPHEAGCSDLAG
jgi:hypothetical protein